MFSCNKQKQMPGMKSLMTMRTRFMANTEFWRLLFFMHASSQQVWINGFR